MKKNHEFLYNLYWFELLGEDKKQKNLRNQSENDTWQRWAKKKEV